MRLPTPIAALTWRADTASVAPRWLLPAAAVLEVVRCPGPEPVPLPLDTDPALVRALLGTLGWRGRPLPLLGLAVEGGGGDDEARTGIDAEPAPRLRAVICPALNDDATPAFGLAALGMPGLLMLREGELGPDAEAADLPPFCAAALRLDDVRYLVPDLDALGAALAPVAALMA